MQEREIGRTGLKVARIGLGGMPMSLAGRPPEEQSIAVIHRAIELGATLIDTADSYCADEEDKHHNERLIAKAIAAYPGDTGQVIVATKGGLMRPKGEWTRNGDPAHLAKTIRESHAALGGEKAIDLWQFHAPDPEHRLEDSLKSARDAAEEGLIRHIGVSNFSVEEIKRAREVCPIVSVQNQYNPFCRNPEDDGVLDYCAENGLSFLPWSPFGGRRRCAKIAEIPVLKEIAAARSASPFQVILAWMLARSPAILHIPGASRVASIENSIAAESLSLESGEVEALNQKLRAE